MDHETAPAAAKRGEPVPTLRVPPPPHEDEPSASACGREPSPGRRERIKGRVVRMRDKLGEHREGASAGTPEGGHRRQDRLLARALCQLVAPDAANGGSEAWPAGAKREEGRAKKQVDRPEFALWLMTNNFRRFNARIGVVFAMQDRLVRLFSWRKPTATLSFLAVYSLACLEPHLVPSIPPAMLLFGVMVPSFLARHPAPAADPRIEPGDRAPPPAPPRRVKPVPAPVLSPDFWRNMRDLQNAMDDFSTLHDAANAYVAPHTDFSDEAVSATLFVALTALSVAALVGSVLVPWRGIALVAGWAATLLGHPRSHTLLLSTTSVSHLRQHVHMLQSTLRKWADHDIITDEQPEVRQVEMFEVQRHHAGSDTWEAWRFCPSPCHPLRPARVAGTRAQGTRLLEDVHAPAGWAWSETKWHLDLLSREWVEERMISGVEIETDGERWVYDLPDAGPPEPCTPNPGHGTSHTAVHGGPRSGWGEGASGDGAVGSWRRRRWVRLVEKKAAAVGGGGGGGGGSAD